MKITKVIKTVFILSIILITAQAAFAEDISYTYEDIGYITGTEILIDGNWYARPGLDTFPDPAQTLGPYQVQAQLADGSGFSNVILNHAASDPWNEVVMDYDSGQLSGQIPSLDPANFNYCQPVWEYFFWLGGNYDGGVEIDERHYDDGSGMGDPYVFFLENPNPNQPPEADHGGPYEVDRWDPITLDASASLDPEGFGLEFYWDIYAEWQDYQASPYVWDDEFDDGTGPNPTITFDENGEYHIRLLVVDECGSDIVVETTVMVYDPHMVVIPQDNFIGANNWHPGTWITLEIDGVVYENAEVQLVNEKDGYGYPFDMNAYNLDVVPGMDVVMYGFDNPDGTGEPIVRPHTVRDHTITSVDFDTDFVEGTAQPGTYVRARVDEPVSVEIVAWADGNGIWTADFAGLADLTPEIQVSVIQQNDFDSSHTMVYIGEGNDERPGPFFIVQPDHRWAEAIFWPLDVSLTLTIDDDDDPGNGIIDDATLPTVPAEWDPEVGVALFDLSSVEFGRGAYITLTDGSTTKTMWVAELYYDQIDTDADIASGTGPANAGGVFNIETPEGHFDVEFSVDSSNQWLVDFGSYGLDVTEYGDTNVIVWDDDGDGTMAHPTEIQLPWLNAVLTENVVTALDWPFGAELTLTIDDPSTPELPDFTLTRFVNGYDPNNPEMTMVDFNLEGITTLEPGFFLTLTDGELLKEHEVFPLEIGGADYSADTFWGTTTPESFLMTLAAGPDLQGIENGSDVGGNWFAQFDIDITPEFLLLAIQPDDDGDATIAILHNQPPKIEALTAPLDPVQTGLAVTAEAVFSDPDSQSWDIAWDWGDGTLDEYNTQETTLANTHIYDEPGVYTVTFSVSDEYGETDTASYYYVVVFDPDGGFVTGGGWITSPEGAYILDPSLSGKATFGFVSKYKKGAAVPTGNTEFQFHAGSLNFKSTSYDWLVIAGKKAMYKGVGTINGEGAYGFMISAIDGDLKDSDGVDTFRIRIWDLATEEIIYDNQLGAADDADPSTAIEGGSIVIHKSK